MEVDLAVWTGTPTQDTIWLIKRLTRVDQDGQRYYRRSLSDGWRRLRYAIDFEDFNKTLDRQRINV